MGAPDLKRNTSSFARLARSASAMFEFRFAQQLNGHTFLGDFGKTKGILLVQDQRNGRSNVFAGGLTMIAIESKPLLLRCHQSQGNSYVAPVVGNISQDEPKQIAAQINISIDVNVIVLRPLRDESLRFFAQQLAGLRVIESSQTGTKRIGMGSFGSRRHDGDSFQAVISCSRSAPKF